MGKWIDREGEWDIDI